MLYIPRYVVEYFLLTCCVPLLCKCINKNLYKYFSNKNLVVNSNPRSTCNRIKISVFYVLNYVLCKFLEKIDMSCFVENGENLAPVTFKFKSIY